MSRRVWILNHYAASMLYSKGGRHYWFAKYLKRRGFEAVVFCANTKHGMRERYVDTEELWTELFDTSIGVPFELVRSGLYEGNGKDRILNMVGFYRNVQKVAKLYAKEHGKPDVIYASSVHPLTLVAGLKLAKHFGVKCICEVRDLWPESIVAYSSTITEKSLIARAMYAGERWIYAKADALIFTMEGGKQYILDKGWDTAHGGPVDVSKIWHINNGIDLESFHEDESNYVYDNEEYLACSNARIVYTGSIRTANNVGFLVDVAECLRDEPVDFFIFGDGDEEPVLRQSAANRGITNIHFMGRVDKRYIPSILSQGMIMMMMYSASQRTISRYGMSQNKLFDYLASGRPIISNLPNDYSVINRHDCGLEAWFDTPQECADAIHSALLDEVRLAAWGENARSTAQLYSFDTLTATLIRVIDSVVTERKAQ